MARRKLSPEEAAWLDSLPAEQRPEALELLQAGERVYYPEHLRADLGELEEIQAREELGRHRPQSRPVDLWKPPRRKRTVQHDAARSAALEKLLYLLEHWDESEHERKQGRQLRATLGPWNIGPRHAVLLFPSQRSETWPTPDYSRGGPGSSRAAARGGRALLRLRRGDR